jgi:restriction system protein
MRARHLESLRKWEQERQKYNEERERKNKQVDQKREKYLSNDTSEIVDYCDMVLSSSEYPDYFPQNFELDYIEETKTLVAEYYLPKLEDIPTVKEWKYVQSKDTVSSTPLSEAFRNKLYDDLVCQIALRSLYELFAADAANALESIVFI